ncbi:MAG: hypothetical protein HY814_05010 [Candidatus Riflebacteria bacterium]|nr:hypothetical protein [Candidatus Riflebacteria bacterium]
MSMKLAAGALLLALASQPVIAAAHRVNLTGAGDQRGFDTFRCVGKISRATGAVYYDRTQDGLRVGQLQPSNDNLSRDDVAHGRTAVTQPEDRIAVIRPVFTETPGSVRGYRVVEVTQKTYLANTQLYRIQDTWGPGSTLAELFDLKRDSTPITQTTLVEMFQRVLDRGNLSSATNGLYVVGTGNLRVPESEPLLFDVLLQEALAAGQTPDSTAVHPLITVTATAEVRQVVIGSDSRGFPVTQNLNFVAFKTNHRGKATIYRIGSSGAYTSMVTNLAVVAGQDYRMVIRNEYLAAGVNRVIVAVVDGDDPNLNPVLYPRGYSGELSMNNPP